jgi:hypothetical protein
VTTLRALAITLITLFIGYVCVTDQLSDVAGLILLLGVAVYAVRTPHINERMHR